MPQAYHYFRVKDIPDLELGGQIETKHQLPLLPVSDADAHTRIKKLGLSDSDYFERFLVEHEDLKEVNARYLGKPLKQLIYIYPFYVFLHNSKDYLVTTGSERTIYKRAFKRLADKNFNIEPSEIELDKFLAAIRGGKTEHLIKGGWFSDLELVGIKAAGIFGTSVDQSDDWERYSETGSLSAVTLEMNFEGASESFMVTKERTLVFYKRKSEQEYLDMCSNFQSLIDSILAGETS